MQARFDAGIFLRYINDIILEILLSAICMSITYHPKRKKRRRTHGFLRRMNTLKGKQVIKRRRQKRRKRLAV